MLEPHGDVLRRARKEVVGVAVFSVAGGGKEREEGGGENELLFWECDKKELRSIKERKEKKYGR